jgi:penicillin-binding protein 1A
VTQAHRQVGSAFKPFVYGAALEMGFTPADTLFDAPTAFLGADNQLSYVPRNYYRKYYGILTLRRALELSINVASVKLLDMVGIDRVVDFAHRCGIESELPPYPSLALGTADLTPLETAAAYAAIANHGTYVAPYLIERVTTADGQRLEQHQPSTRTAMDPRVAFVLTYMLEGVVDRGTAAKAAGLDLDLAGKTGTTDDYSDAWFVGFTPRYTLLSWVGYDVKRSIGRNMTGAEAALPIWKSLVEAGLADGWLSPGERFTPPPGVVVEPVDYLTGLLPGPGAERTIEEAFVAGTEPVQSYEPIWATIVSLPWYQQRPFYIPKEGEKMPTADMPPAEDPDGEEHAGD